MKKILYSLAIVAVVMGGCKKEDEKKDGGPGEPKPQVEVVKKNTSLMIKTSGTRCAPCGGWGWNISENMIDYGKGKSLYMGIFSANFVSEGFITNVANEMDAKYRINSWPSFFVNGSKINKNGKYTNTNEFENEIKEGIDGYQNKNVIANSGVKYSIENGTMKISASVKFFEEATGDFNLAFYVIENKAMWAQSGNPASNGKTPIEHHYVLRGSSNGTWGEMFSTGTIGINKFKDVNSEIKLDPSWKIENLDVYAVIWQKTNEDYKFINISNTK